MAEKKEELTAIVSRKHVFDDPETMEAYSRDNSFTPPRKPHLVVRPKNVDEVQKIVKWANQTRTTLVPMKFWPATFPR